MRSTLLALVGLVAACQLPDLAPPASSSDNNPAPRPGDDLDGASVDPGADTGGDTGGDTGIIDQQDDPEGVIAGDPEGRVLRGSVVDPSWAGGDVVAISSSGATVEAIIAEDGAFAVSLARGETWTLHLRAADQPIVTFHFQRNAWSTETTTRLTIPADDAPPPGAPPPGDDDSDDMDLGAVTPADGTATTESNPLEAVDADGDGMVDFEDPDDDDDGVWDELDGEPEVDSSALGLIIAKSYPALGSDGVDPDDEIMVEFNMELDPSSVMDTSIRLIGPDGADLPGTVESDRADLYFQPADLMQPGESYAVIVGEGLRASSGDTLVGDQRWTFRVEAEADTPPAWLAIESIDPRNGEVVDAAATLSVEFNQAMAAASVYLRIGGLQVIGPDGVELDGLLAVDDDRV